MMAASKPTSSLFMHLHLLYTELNFGTLSVNLACLPFANRAYPLLTDSRGNKYAIRSLIEFGTQLRALVQPVLYLRIVYLRG